MIATRNPTSDTAVSGTWTGAAGSRYTLVDDHPDSTGADYLSHGTTAGWIVLGFPAFSVPTGATAISINVYWYDRKASTSGNNIRSRLRIGGADYNHASSVAPVNGVWTSRTQSYATNPRTSAAWTVNDVNGVGVNGLTGIGWYSTDANPVVMLSSIQIEVVYTPYNANGTATVSGAGGVTNSGAKGSRGSASVPNFGASAAAVLKGSLGLVPVSCIGEMSVEGQAATESYSGSALVACLGFCTAVGMKSAGNSTSCSATGRALPSGLKGTAVSLTIPGAGDSTAIGDKWTAGLATLYAAAGNTSAGWKGAWTQAEILAASWVASPGMKGMGTPATILADSWPETVGAKAGARGLALSVNGAAESLALKGFWLQVLMSSIGSVSAASGGTEQHSAAVAGIAGLSMGYAAYRFGEVTVRAGGALEVLCVNRPPFITDRLIMKGATIRTAWLLHRYGYNTPSQIRRAEDAAFLSFLTAEELAALRMIFKRRV